MKNLPENMTNKRRKWVKDLLFRYQSIMSTEKHDNGQTTLVEHQIDTGENRPIRHDFWYHSFKYLEWIDNKVNDMVSHGIVEPAALPWFPNFVLVKKDGSLRFCVDYQRLNVVMKQDAYLLTLIDNCLNVLTRQY